MFGSASAQTSLLLILFASLAPWVKAVAITTSAFRVPPSGAVERAAFEAAIVREVGSTSRSYCAALCSSISGCGAFLSEGDLSMCRLANAEQVAEALHSGDPDATEDFAEGVFLDVNSDYFAPFFSTAVTTSTTTFTSTTTSTSTTTTSTTTITTTFTTTTTASTTTSISNTTTSTKTTTSTTTTTNPITSTSTSTTTFTTTDDLILCGWQENQDGDSENEFVANAGSDMTRKQCAQHCASLGPPVNGATFGGGGGCFCEENMVGFTGLPGYDATFLGSCDQSNGKN